MNEPRDGALSFPELLKTQTCRTSDKQTNKQKTPPCCALYESLTHMICEDYMWLFYATKLWDNL